MKRRDFFAIFALVGSAAFGSGCKSKATTQSEIAAQNVDRLLKLVAERHVDSMPRALPAAAKKLGPPLEKVPAKFVEMRDKTDDLRASKRSFFAVVDPTGTVTWVDESNWKVEGRVLSVGFPSVQEVLDGKLPWSRGTGRFGGDPEDALIFMDAAPIKDDGGKIAGALVCAWEAIDVATDLQSQILTEMGMESADPNVHNKVKEQRKKQMEQPDVWVAIFRGKVLYMPEDAYQPLLDSAKQLDLLGKTQNGKFVGTFDVVNSGWGVAAARIPSMGDGVGVAVFRHKS